MNSFPTFSAAPIRYVPLVTNSATDEGFEFTQQNVKTRKPSEKTDGKVKSGKNIERKNQNEAHGESSCDFSGVPPPVCSCTGVARRCYRYGPGAWQSTCCTTSMSEYPLPMNPARPGRRITGRKMKRGAYAKLLSKFAAEGHDLSYPVDLKNYWGKRATTK